MRAGLVVDEGEAFDERTAVVERLFAARYVPMVRLAVTLVGGLAEAEEVVQEAFVDVFRRLDELHTPEAYLRVAVVSRCRSVLRRRRTVEGAPLERPTGASDEVGELWDVLAALPEQQRLAVVLRYYGGYRSSEIAELLGCPASTVRSSLRRGLAALRKTLS